MGLYKLKCIIRTIIFEKFWKAGISKKFLNFKKGSTKPPTIHRKKSKVDFLRTDSS